MNKLSPAFYRWIDLALDYGRYDGDPEYMWRLRRRTAKTLRFFEALRPSAEASLATERRQIEADSEKLRAFAGAVGLWARSERLWLRNYFPQSLIDRLLSIAPPVLDADPTLFAQQYIDALLADARPKLECVRNSGRLEVQADMRGVHLFSTLRWINWIAQPSKAHECGCCGRAFFPTRSDAKYCGDACRVAASKKRNEERAAA